MSTEKFQNKYRIPSARAGWWDYSADALYFITICTAGMECLFGKIVKTDDNDGVCPVETHGRASLPPQQPKSPQTIMQLSPIGEIINQEWKKSFEIRTELFCDTYVIMPNHIHAILRIDRINVETRAVQTHAVETHGRASLQQHHHSPQQNQGIAYRPPKSISSFVAGFKSVATVRVSEYRNTPKQSIWQTRFHDHIIRNEKEYWRIARYIAANPENWEGDKFYKE